MDALLFEWSNILPNVPIVINPCDIDHLPYDAPDPLPLGLLISKYGPSGFIGMKVALTSFMVDRMDGAASPLKSEHGDLYVSLLAVG